MILYYKISLVRRFLKGKRIRTSKTSNSNFIKNYNKKIIKK